ncbi:MAG: hypothetical protein II551_06080 [Paludibacteraceae bacterium]|nr:hypothetical protein [Paludibacteraceae bacterium]
MYDERIEGLISAALADGELTEKEKQILFKKAQAEGIDLDEFEMVLDARLVELKKAEKAAEAAKSAPKSNKYGDVRKCPNCGAMVPSLAGTCPECGYEFSGIEANSSSKKLAEQILECFSNEKRSVIIETFPVPNTKADLFEFLTAIQPRMRDVSDPLSAAYLKKYEECINKAKATFPTDPNLRPFIETFEEEKKVLKRKHSTHAFFAWFGRHKVLTVFLVLFLIGLPGAIMDIIKENRADQAKEDAIERVENAIKSEDQDEIMAALKEAPKIEKEKANNWVVRLLEDGHLDEALYLYEKRCKEPSTYRNDEACKALYAALIDAERMDEAWKYVELTDPDENGIANVDDVKRYMTDVVEHYCKQGKKDEARQFVKEHLVWYINNIDNNAELGAQDKKDYGSDAINKQMTKLINNY